ncbi:ABC transporter permease [Clostridium sp. CX1]|uniref:ABC transporter permease n=1 Tax=Clostridium tanneri TaxID=3037988 RepID=A0ABU4JVI9_9CLOT|nr:MULTISPECIES: ABC transporter permease [unclassified Clostridium]MCT8975193.1 ABC transporter permease [Clostridium sp. CX1]MDW8802170.1 ABC transporter permease [Clostridium sp. A1-XYC3]
MEGAGNLKVGAKLRGFNLGVREKIIISTAALAASFIAVLVAGSIIDMDALRVNLVNIFISPSLDHPFGTDWVGRDMLLRTVKGLSISMKIGILCSVTSGFIAMILGVAAPLFGGKVDYFISWLIDLMLSVPHTLVIILISIAVGGGLKGIVIGVALTHWTSLTRVIRAEVMQIKEMEYTKISRKFGKSSFYIAKEHVLPHIIPQLVVGMVLVFPHAILHEASVTFLGFGLPPHEPAIGVILSESMKYLTSGKWWLAFFPGFSLVLISMLVDCVGKNIGKLINPKKAYK